MRNMILIALAVFALGSASLAQSAKQTAKPTPHAKSAASAHKHAAAKKPKAKAKQAALVCPVTGEKIASVKQAAGHSTYKGKTYYFCCPMCKPKFDKAPAKYIENAKRGKFEKMGM